jgi:transposase-like protein
VAKHRTEYLPPFKAKVIPLVLRAGRSVTQITKEFEIHIETLSNWVKTQKLNPLDKLKALTQMKSLDLCEMETEIERFRLENEFLKDEVAVNSFQGA